ncbi:hypothetical protein ACWDUL_25395 [Nocardia niigatensis]|uniref:hypothetical protein n=1 Tax=Nocardia niigatensis TaxID=209249 RepID=UPI0012F673DE|nr:hypothetical protein [Nocardia niigatensis]
MTRRYGGSRTSASRRALLPIVGAIPLAVAVTCSVATADAAAQPSDPAAVFFEQLQTGPVQPGVPTIPAAILDQAKNAAAAAQAAVGDGLHTVPVDTRYSDNATNLNVGSGAAGLIIGAVVGAVPGAVIGAVPGALIGAAVGAAVGGVAGGLAMAVPTLGVGAPIGAVGGVLAGAGIGAVIGAVLSAIVSGITIGVIGAAVGYELGAATGIGNGLQGG